MRLLLNIEREISIESIWNHFSLSRINKNVCCYIAKSLIQCPQRGIQQYATSFDHPPCQLAVLGEIDFLHTVLQVRLDIFFCSIEKKHFTHTWLTLRKCELFTEFPLYSFSCWWIYVWSNIHIHDLTEWLGFFSRRTRTMNRPDCVEFSNMSPKREIIFFSEKIDWHRSATRNWQV